MKNKNKQTRFPAARIKKIMQKDDEVGKVAQATPVVISKALELFLGNLVDCAASVTKERGAKRLEAYHLKHAVETTDMMDFLRELFVSVPDPSAGGTIDLAAEKAEAGKRRRKAPGEPRKKRKKKGEPAVAEEQDEDAGQAVAPDTGGTSGRDEEMDSEVDSE